MSTDRQAKIQAASKGTGTGANAIIVGGIVAIVPGQMSICVWSPRLDSYGNSVAGLRSLETLVEGLGVAPLG